MARVADDDDLERGVDAVEVELEREPAVRAQGLALSVRRQAACGDDRLACCGAPALHRSADLHEERFLRGRRVGPRPLRVGLQLLGLRREGRYPLRVLPRRLVLQRVSLGEVVRLQHPQAGHLHLEVHPLLYERVARGERLQLGVGERRLIHVGRRPHGRLRGHDLPDEALLALDHLVQVRVEGALGHVAVRFDLLVHVPLALDAAEPLLEVGRPPRAVEVVNRDKPSLHVGPRAHLLRRAHEDAHRPGVHPAEERQLLRLGVGVVDEGDLIIGHAPLHELAPQVVVHAEPRAALRC